MQQTGRKHSGPNGSKWVLTVPFVKRCCFFGNLRALRQILDCSRSSSSGVESNLRQRRNASARGIFQNRPKPPNSAILAIAPAIKGFSPLIRGFLSPPCSATVLLQSEGLLLPSTLPIFQRLKPPFLKPLLVHPQLGFYLSCHNRDL